MKTRTLPSFDEFQFGGRRPYVVDGHATAEGFETTGLSFQDAAAMQTSTHKLFHGRGTPPTWAINNSELKLLLARAMELRARIYFPRNDSPEKRIRFAQKKLQKDRRAGVALRNSVAAQMKAGCSPERRSALERRLKTYNGELAISKNAAVILCGIVHWYFRVGLSSQECAVAMRNVVTPGNVRKIASEFVKLWQQMQSGKDRQRKPTPAKRPRVVLTAKQRAARAKKRKWRQEHKEQVRQDNHASHSSPEFRARMSAVAKAGWADPEARARRIAAQKASWTDEARARKSATMKAVCSTPETRARMSATQKAAWADPEVRARRMAASTPEVQARRKAAIAAACSTPEARARQAVLSKGYWARWRAERALADALIEHVHRPQGANVREPSFASQSTLGAACRSTCLGA